MSEIDQCAIADLTSQVNELEQQLLEANAKIERLTYLSEELFEQVYDNKVLGDLFEQILDESPAQSLAEHDADVIELMLSKSGAGSLYTYDIHQYAEQLRRGGDK